MGSLIKPGIKPATSEEKEWSARLLAASEPWISLGITLAQCRKTCNESDYQLYIALLEEKPCGLILLDPRGLAGSPYVKSIAVSDEFRNMGVGSALMNFAEEHFRKESRHIFLCVSSFNTKAQKFYERLGYKKAGEFPDYIVEGQSEFLMYKRLR